MRKTAPNEEAAAAAAAAYSVTEETSTEQRHLEDLWKQVFPVGTEWNQLDLVYQYKWNFSNLENAFEEGEELHGKKVYLFASTERSMESDGNTCGGCFFENPLKKVEQSTFVYILYPVELKPEYTDELVEKEELSEDQKDAFKEFVKEKVREAKKANREAREARKKELEEMSEERGCIPEYEVL